MEKSGLKSIKKKLSKSDKVIRIRLVPVGNGGVCKSE